MARERTGAGANGANCDMPREGPRRVSFTVSEELWRLLEAETAREGVALDDYARESILCRLSFERGRRDGVRLRGAASNGAGPGA